MSHLPFWLQCLCAIWSTTFISPFLAVMFGLEGHGTWKALWPLLAPFYTVYLLFELFAHTLDVAPSLPKRFRRKMHSLL